MGIQLLGLYLLVWKCFIVIGFGPIPPSSMNFSSLFPRLPPMKMPKDKIPVKAPNLAHDPSWQLLPEKCGLSSHPSDRIIGGKDASLGEYPWMVQVGRVEVSIYKSAFHWLCGGSLISEWYTITAGHCVESSLSEGSPTARLGENHIHDDVDCENNVCAPKPIDIPIEFFLIHKEYDGKTVHYDIGLAKFKTQVTFNDFIKPICLPSAKMIQDPSGILKIGDMVEVAGWGLMDAILELEPNKLQRVSLPIVSMQICKTVFRHLVLDQSQLCVGEGHMRDSCLGDSGGPVMKIINSDEGPPRYYLFGIVSFGTQDCGTSSAVYVNVMHNMKWILYNIDPARE